MFGSLGAAYGASLDFRLPKQKIRHLVTGSFDQTKVRCSLTRREAEDENLRVARFPFVKIDAKAADLLA